jgi:RNA polymerase sigma-70 factor (ECF subfamily)
MEGPINRDSGAVNAAFGGAFPGFRAAVSSSRKPEDADLPQDAGGSGETDPDAVLMLAYARGDAAAFDTLYARHCGGSYRYFLRSLRNPGLAQELLQDLWMNVIRARSSYEAQARFATWLYRMAHNRLIDHYRRSSVVELVALEDEESESMQAQVADNAPGPEASASARQSAGRLLQLVEALPAVQREAFLMQEEGGLSLAEIATATGAGIETVKSRLRYAMARLREGMKDFT